MGCRGGFYGDERIKLGHDGNGGSLNRGGLADDRLLVDNGSRLADNRLLLDDGRLLTDHWLAVLRKSLADGLVDVLCGLRGRLAWGDGLLGVGDEPFAVDAFYFKHFVSHTLSGAVIHLGALSIVLDVGIEAVDEAVGSHLLPGSGAVLLLEGVTVVGAVLVRLELQDLHEGVICGSAGLPLGHAEAASYQNRYKYLPR